jgi:hypothetical protein
VPPAYYARVDFEEFDRLTAPLRERSATMAGRYGFPLIGAHTASPEDIAWAESALGVTLPAKYKTLMSRYGGGQFGFVDLLPVRATSARHRDDIVSVSQKEFPDGSYVAVAPVGTGDFWGFPVADARCRDEVWFCFHDAGEPAAVASDFLEFIARHGIQPRSAR